MEERNYKRWNYYKGKYFIVFYDQDGENFINMFNNIREILEYRGEKLTRQNLMRINVELYRSLKSKNHYTRMLSKNNSELQTVFIVDINDEDK